jgi:predicted RNA-binding protein with PUA-like domain
MNYWLLKSEPGDYSWSQLVKDGKTPWDGVRNYQARNNLKAMKVGDLGFFYHSVHEKAVVGIMEVIGEYYIDPKDETGRFVAVDMKPVKALKRPITLDEIKHHEILTNLPLLKQSRLSVMPLKKVEWDYIIELSKS